MKANLAILDTEYFQRPDMFHRWTAAVAITFFNLFLGFPAMFTTDMYGVQTPLIFVFGLVIALATAAIPELGRLHPLYGLPGWEQRGYRRRGSLTEELETYLRLPKDDKKLFPPNLIERAKQPMSAKNREALRRSIKDTLNKIDERNLQRHKLELDGKSYLIESVLEDMKYTRESLDIEIDTYKKLG